MATKQAKQSTFSAICRAGTPNHLEEETKNSPAYAKGFLAGRVSARKKWADKYSRPTADALSSILVEIDQINLQTVRVGEVRSWSARDEYSGVEFVFEIEVVTR